MLGQMRVPYVIPSLRSPSGCRSHATASLNAMRDKIEPGDADSLANALSRLLNDPDHAAQMGMANRSWAETLTWERTAQEQHQAYQEALQTV